MTRLTDEDLKSIKFVDTYKRFIMRNKMVIDKDLKPSSPLVKFDPWNTGLIRQETKRKVNNGTSIVLWESLAFRIIFEIKEKLYERIDRL
jgi:hypothetical protein